MVENPLPGWLAEIAADSVAVHADNIGIEASANMWSISLSPEQTEAVSAAEVEEFVRAIAVARGKWLAAHGKGPMTLYCWHDEQAGQLRFSLVSASHGRVPFGCEVVPVEDLAAVVRGFLDSPYLSGIPWSDLRLLTTDDVEDIPPLYQLLVWQTSVP